MVGDPGLVGQVVAGYRLGGVVERDDRGRWYEVGNAGSPAWLRLFSAQASPPQARMQRFVSRQAELEPFVTRVIASGYVDALRHVGGAPAPCAFVVTPPLPGESLAAKIARGGLAPGDALSLGVGLAAAFGRGLARVTPLDAVAPPDVRVTGDPARPVIITENGLSRALGFEAPGSGGNGLAAIYNLGALIFAMLVGRAPSPDEGLPASVSFPHRDLVERMIRRNPAERPASLLEVRRVLDPPPLPAPEPPAPEPRRPGSSRAPTAPLEPAGPGDVLYSLRELPSEVPATLPRFSGGARIVLETPVGPATTCGACGSSVPAHYKFCGSCGSAVGHPSAPGGGVGMMKTMMADVHVSPSASPAPGPGATSGRRVTAGRDAVDCSVFSPPRVPAGEAFLVQVFAHTVEGATEAASMAVEFDEDATRRGTTKLSLEVPRGALLMFELEVRNAKVTAPVDTIVWEGTTQSATFEVQVPPESAGKRLIGRLIVAQNDVAIGSIRFMVKAEGSVPAEPEDAGAARRYRYAFISYASADRDQVMQRLQMLESLGIDFFQDILTLDPGSRWERELYRHIDRADVFFLFWSDAARASEWVRKEIQYALERKAGDDGRPPDIMPVLLGGRPIAPPSELQHIHFGSRVSYLMGR